MSCGRAFMPRKTPFMPRKSQKTSGGVLQRHHLEISLICSSGIVIYRYLSSAGLQDWGLQRCGWLVAHLSSLLLEFGGHKIASPYHLRRSESHGLAQGVLAVPSVLAALAVTVPGGAFQHWLLGSCAAVVAILFTVYIQSHKVIAARRAHAGRSSSTADSFRVATAVQQKQPMHDGIVHNTAISNAQQQCSAHMCGTQRYIVPLLVVSLAAIAASWASPVQDIFSQNYLSSLPSLQQVIMLPSIKQAALVGAAAVATAFSHSSAALASSVTGAVLAPTLYCLIMQVFPQCFSIGEGAMMAQGAAGVLAAAVLLAPNALLFVPKVVCQVLPPSVQHMLANIGTCSSSAHQEALTLRGLSAAVTLIVATVLLICLLLHGVTVLLQQQCHGVRQISKLAGISSLTLGITALLLWLACAAIWTLVEFLPAKPGRLLLLVYWVFLLAVTLPALRVWASHSRVPQIVVRKVYHLLAGALFVPVFFWDFQLLCLSLAIAFAALVLLEVLRKLDLPHLGQAIQRFMQDFVDERDSGVIYVTHFTLLLGLAVPMWLCLGLPGIQDLFVDAQRLAYSSEGSAGAACSGSDANSCGLQGLGFADSAEHLLHQHSSSASLLPVMAGLSGIIIIGVGDTAASMVGKLLGQVPIHVGSRKTVEGTVAGITSSLGAWCCLLSCVGIKGGGWWWWMRLVAATVGAGLLEACTSQLDNILLPLWYMPHLLLL